MRIILSTCLCLFFFFQVFSQRNYLPGYVILSGKDTLKGLIDYRNWEKNPSNIFFKTSEGAESKSYTVTDIEGFEVYNHDIYKRANVLVDKNAVDLNDVKIYQEQLIQRETVFLRLLAKGGNLTLYELQDSKSHFFIQKGESEIKELGYKKQIDERTEDLVTRKEYINQLKEALSGNALSYELNLQIDKLEYDASSLRKFIMGLSGDRNSVNVPGNEDERVHPVFFIGGGLIYHDFGFSSPIYAYRSLKFSPIVSYIVTAGIDVYGSRNFNRVVFRAELSYSAFQIKNSNSDENINGYYYQYSIKRNNITPSLSVLYNFIKNSSIKVYAGAGANYNLSSYPENKLVKTDVMYGNVTTDKKIFEGEKAWFELYLRAGVVLIKKFQIDGGYQLSGSPYNLGTTKEKGKRLVIRVSYRFR